MMEILCLDEIELLNPRNSNFLTIFSPGYFDRFFYCVVFFTFFFFFTCSIEGKEIQLQHRAPVVSMSVINIGHKLFHVDDTPSHPGAHYVIICSEEQIKVRFVSFMSAFCQ